MRQRRRQIDLAAQFFILLALISCLSVTALFGVVALAEGDLGPGAADLNPLERYGLRVYLRAQTAALQTPSGPDDTPVEFSVAPGETASQVASRLAALGLVQDAQLLTRYMRYQGLDSSIEAGDFALRQTMTIPAIALALTDAHLREIQLRIFEGWRREQVVDALRNIPALSAVANDFDTLTGPNQLTPRTYAFLADLPSGVSLEGYLYPATYIFKPETTALEILNRLLDTLNANLPANYAAQVQAQGLSVHEAFILASLVEREAVLDEERPIIASVILNRLAIGQQLEIDATVQYAIAQPGNWWPPVQGLDFRNIADPHNTYFITGLPAGPIANPRLASLLAVAQPAATDYYFYRALCDGSGRHAFAVTYAEHIANACP